MLLIFLSFYNYLLIKVHRFMKNINQQRLRSNTAFLHKKNLQQSAEGNSFYIDLTWKLQI